MDSQPDLFGLILAGGAGTRLWPISREQYPKQLLPLSGSGHSLLQEGFSRLSRTIDPRRIVTVTSQAYAHEVQKQVHELADDVDAANVLGEPMGRDSGPAVLWGALRILTQSPEAVVVLVWSDQLIRQEQAFDEGVAQAYEAVRDGGIVLMGVPATRPLSTLGYIKRGPEVRPGIYEVERFVEKPDPATAERLVMEGTYLWNPGVIVFKAATLVEAFERHAPQVIGCFREQGALETENDWFDAALIESIYRRLSRESLDYVVLEKAEHLNVIPVELEWSDLGTWDELYYQQSKDTDGNALVGNVVALDTRNTFIRGSRRLVATVGVEDLVVVDTDDAVLVCNMRKVHDIKHLVEHLRERGLPEADAFESERRPWGSFSVLASGPSYKVKVVHVNPGHKLSLQLHQRRDEHWVVAAGEARLTCNEHVGDYRVNQYLFIPRGAKHRIENAGEFPLSIIEVQQGSYLGEDDIVRFDDIYGRA